MLRQKNCLKLKITKKHQNSKMLQTSKAFYIKIITIVQKKKIITAIN